MAHEGPAEVFKVMPDGVGWDKIGAQILAWLVGDGQQQGLLGVRSPLRVDGRVVRPGLADPGALPTPSGVGNGKGECGLSRPRHPMAHGTERGRVVNRRRQWGG